MLSWYIKSYCNLRDHPKARKLARLLNTSANEARGVLHCLWWWSLSYAESGNLSRYDPEEIAEACDWHGDARQLLAALIESGFIPESFEMGDRERGPQRRDPGLHPEKAVLPAPDVQSPPGSY